MVPGRVDDMVKSGKTGLEEVPDKPGALKVTLVAVSALKPYPKNARTHSRKQIRQVADSISAFGFNAPILIDENNMVLAGHCRLAAGKAARPQRGSPASARPYDQGQKQGFILADNKLSQLAGWMRRFSPKN